MTQINWNETIPSITSIVGSFPRYANSVWTAISTGLATEHFWPGTGGGSDASIGDLLPGASRAFFDVKSNASSANTGTLYLTSDTSQLLTAFSTGTWQLGTPYFDSYATSAGTCYWARQTGTSVATVVAGGSQSTITFVIPFVATPAIYITPSTASYVFNLNTIGLATAKSLGSALANAPSLGTYTWEAFGLVSSGSF